MQIQNGLVFCPDGTLKRQTVSTRGDRILETGEGPVLDASGCIVAPGFIDCHIHGACNHDFCEASPQAHGAIARYLASVGVTGYLGTTMAQATEAVAAKAGLTLSDFPCVGAGTPSCINPFTGRLVFSGNINLKDVPLRDALEHRLGRPVYIGNDANCAIIGEALAGGAKDCQNVLMLTLGTGVGGGVILNGKLFAGADGMGTELGHIPLIAGGEHCSCGTDGCLEAYASVTALIRQTKAAMEAHPESSLHAHVEENGPVNGKTVFDCAQAGDAVSQQVIDQYIDYLARGIGGLVNIFRPEVVLIGGGLSGQGENLLAPPAGSMQTIRLRQRYHRAAGDPLRHPGQRCRHHRRRLSGSDVRKNNKKQSRKALFFCAWLWG
ncbi:MAG: ROK family protein [Clostridia bacterium]|nr:ROK family protein [Clostridia bacterium]